MHFDKFNLPILFVLQHHFEMLDGVVHVFPNKDGKSTNIGS